MRVFFFYTLIIIFLVLPLILIQSCAKVEDEDTNPPQISEVFFNRRDTIMWNGEVISINNNVEDDLSRIDTLPIGKMTYVRAHLVGGERSLSSYIVVLDSMPGAARIDSLFRFKRLGNNIFGRTDTLIERNNLMLIPEYQVKTINNIRDTLYTHQGDYSMRIVCGNKFNMRDSLMYTVKVLTRDSIYKIRKGL